MIIKAIKAWIRARKPLFFLAKIFYSPITVVKKMKGYLSTKKIALANLKEIQKIEITTTNIFFFGIPHHMNIGDMAQKVCINRWIEKTYPNAKVIEIYTASTCIRSVYKVIKSKITTDNLLIFQSGYTSHEKHPDHKMHLKIVSDFPENRILFMPQTVNILSKHGQQKTKKIYSNKHNLYFLARDKYSYQMISNLVHDTNIFLYPDIVTTLVGHYDSNFKRNGILLCMRDDYEKAINDKDINSLIITLKQYSSQITITDTTINCITYNEFNRNFNEILKDTIENYSKYKLIITDRYHGTIFSVIAQTPVIVIATRDHKVVSGAEWFEESYMGDVYLVRNIDDAIMRAKEILMRKNYFAKTNNYFQVNYYDKLKTILER